MLNTYGFERKRSSSVWRCCSNVILEITRKSQKNTGFSEAEIQSCTVCFVQDLYGGVEIEWEEQLLLLLYLNLIWNHTPAVGP
jgi:hypothetical protein